MRRLRSWASGQNLLVIPIILLIVILPLFSDRFLTVSNMLNVLRAASIYIIMGVGQAFLMTSRNIDLSIGSMLALIMGVTGTYLFFGGSVVVAILLALALGLICGSVNGTLVARFKVPALLATLGMMVAFRGIIQQFLYGTTVSRFPDFIVYLGQGFVGVVPIPVVIAIVIAIIGSLIYHFTKFGRYAVAIGGNEEAAILAGIKVRRWKVIFYLFQGVMVAIAALVFLGRLNAAHGTLGVGLELHVIAGTALGGTSLFGGRGTMFGVVLGMGLISLLENGLMLAGAGFFIQSIVLGFLLVTAVAIQVARSSKLGD